MYDKSSVQWRDVTQTREDMFLSILAPWLDRDAIADRVINRPMWIFAPGSGAVAGCAVPR
jgi:hypothetical protein